MPRACLSVVLTFSSIVFSDLFSHNASAQQANDGIAAHLNESTFTIVGGGSQAGSAQLIEDLAVLLGAEGKRRVLPVLDSDSVSGVSDVLYLKGIDAAIVHEDALESIRQNKVFPDVGKKIQYVSKLSRANIHIVANRSIATVSDLAGKTVNIGPGRKSANNTPTLLFASLGIKVLPVNMRHKRAIARVNSGEIAATVIAGGSLDDIAQKLAGADNVWLLPIPLPTDSEYYVPVEVEARGHAHILPSSGRFSTVAVAQVLIVKNWAKSHPRYRKVTNFVQAFFNRFGELSQEGYLDEWKQVNLGAQLPNWTRFPGAQSWLDASSPPDPSALIEIRKFFDGFIAEHRASADGQFTAEKRAEIFNTFLSWAENPIAAEITMRRTSVSGAGDVVGTINAKNQATVVNGRKEAGVALTPKMQKLKPGRYALHVHEKPNCTAAERNGKLVPGLDAGDRLVKSLAARPGVSSSGRPLGSFPDLQVKSNGTATMPIFASGLTLADLVDRSIVIHVREGNSSARAFCGVVK